MPATFSSARRVGPYWCSRVAIAEAGDLGLTEFAGFSVDETAVVLKVTDVGDANLDGQVDALDYEQVDLNIGNGVGAPLGLLATSASTPTGGLAELFSKKRLDEVTALWA